MLCVRRWATSGRPARMVLPPYAACHVSPPPTRLSLSHVFIRGLGSCCHMRSITRLWVSAYCRMALGSHTFALAVPPLNSNGSAPVRRHLVGIISSIIRTTG